MDPRDGVITTKGESLWKVEIPAITTRNEHKKGLYIPLSYLVCLPVGKMSSGHIGFSTDFFAFPLTRNFVCFLSIIAVTVMSFWWVKSAKKEAGIDIKLNKQLRK